MATVREGFIEAQLRGLDPLDFVAFLVADDDGIRGIEVLRDEDGPGFLVEIAGEPELPAETVTALTGMGFAVAEGNPNPVLTGADPARLAEAVDGVLSGPFAAPPEAAVDVRHGSRREERAMELKLAECRARLGPLLESMLEPDSLEVDDDEDFTFAFESTRVWVAPRVIPGGPLIVRVLAVTNVDVDPSPALGLFLAQTNFGLPFGRFSLDARQRAVWFEETLLGDYFTDEELRFFVGVVASTADQFDDHIAETFGGRVFNEAGRAGESVDVPSSKPGTGGYL